MSGATSAKLDSLLAAIDGSHLRRVLAEYEATGDHVHSRPWPPGTACPGGDCIVAKARRVLAAMEPEATTDTRWRVAVMYRGVAVYFVNADTYEAAVEAGESAFESGVHASESEDETIDAMDAQEVKP